MSINVNNNNEVTVKTENKEETIMSNSTNTKTGNTTMIRNNRKNRTFPKTGYIPNRYNENGNAKTASVKNIKNPKEAVMPKDELAVDDKIIVTVSNLLDFSSLILPEEVAEENTQEQKNMKKYRKLGFFSPTRGMANISNRLDGRLYANIHEDEKGQRNVVYLQKYINGGQSPQMSLSQAGLRIAFQNNFSSKDIKETKLRNKVSNFLSEANDVYYGTFKGKEEDELKMTDILTVLHEALPFLPVKTDKLSEMEEETFYSMLDYNINNLTSWSVNEHKSYYALEESDIETLAHDMGIKKLELLKKLKQYGYLYLTPSSKGYQTNVRVKGACKESYTDWRYCIYKLSYFAGLKNENPNALGLDEF